MAQLHQLAGLAERDQLLRTEPSAVTRLLLRTDDQDRTFRRFKNMQDALDAIAASTFEMTLTGHPTNTNSVESMQLQRMLGIALRSGDDAAIDNALQKFAATPVLPMRDGVATPLNVQQETQAILYALGNIYEDLPETYHAFDQDLTAHYDAAYTPKDLKLNIVVHSWGSSGDKDGNKKVNGDTTLYAVAQHKHEILRRYAEDMQGIQGMEAAQQALQQAATDAGEIAQAIDKILEDKNAGFLTAEQFESFSAELKQATDSLDLGAMMTALEHHLETDQTDKKALNLLRRMRTFGLSFGHIEYRETSEEYTRIVNLLIPHYEALKEEEKCAQLSALIENPPLLASRMAALREALKDAPGKSYIAKPDDQEDAPQNIYPIAYQTMRRMELARDFPETFQNNVLAECGGTSNMLEALLLQHAVARDGKRAMLGVVPLFEEHATLKEAPAIIQRALETPTYQAHLHALADAHGKGLAQQVQLAHSDNAKRAGMPAARALVDKAHEEIQAAITVFNQTAASPVALQFYEGGSQSDPYRGGARSISAAINQYGLHRFSKMTYQGIDLLNYLNLPFASERLFTRNIANNALKLREEPRGQIRPFSTEDRRVIAAFDNVKEDYLRLFEDGQFRDFLNKLGYANHVYGNFTSRAGARTGSEELKDINRTRAIGLSETMQHAGLIPTFIGASRAPLQLSRYFPDTSPSARRALYQRSPVFRDIIDRMLYGLARTDLDLVEATSGNHLLVQAMRDEYTSAFTLCMETYTGKSASELLGGRDPKTVAQARMRQVVVDAVYPHTKEIYEDQNRLLSIANNIQGWIKAAPGKAESAEKYMAHLVHNMKDAALLGRMPLIDDPSYARLYCTRHGIQRPYVNDNAATKSSIRAA